MRTVAIIQARLGSTRLTNKVLADIAGHPLLWHVVNRTRKAKTLDDVVVATSFSEADRQLVEWCQLNSVPVYRGGSSEDDVLGRYHDAAIDTQADIIVRICGDSPMVDLSEIDRVVNALNGGSYVTNAPNGKETLPDGLDCEAFSWGALDDAWREAASPADREHVTPWMQRQPTAAHIDCEEGNFSHLRFCVDDAQDLAFARAVFAELGEDFAWRDVVKLLGARPDIAALMGKARRTAGREKKRV